MKKILLPLLAAVACGGISTSALAQTSGNWTNTAGGDWNTATNWSSNPTVPGGNGTAVNLNADFTTGSKTINLNADAIVGTMIFGDSNATGPSALTLSGANTLFFNNNGSNATLTWQGSASNKISSAIKLDDNLVVSGLDTTGGFQGAISSNSAGEKTIYINNYNVFSGSISDGAGVVGLNRVVSKALFLSGNNTFSGGVNLNNTTAQLSLGHENALGTGTLSLGTGSSVIVNVTSSNAIAKNLSFSGGQLTGSGNLTIEAMTIRAAGSTINRSGDTLITGPVYLSENATASRGLTFGGSSNGNGSISGVISDYNGSGVASGITKLGTGTWTLSAANTYTGETKVGSNGGSSGGILQLSGDGKISTATVSVFSGALDLNGTSQTVYAIAMANAVAGAASANILIGSGTLNLDGTQSGSISFSANTNNVGATISGIGGGTLNLNRNRNFVIADSTNAEVDLTVSAIVADGDATARNVSKTGVGTMEFSGANTYTGSTSVSAGTLLITGNSTTSTGAITVSALATLGGSGTIGGAVTVSDTGILGAGTPSAATATLTLNNKDLTISGIDSKLNFDINGIADGQFDKIIGIAALSQSGDVTFTLSGTYATASWGVLGFSTQSSNFDTITLAGSYIGNLSRSGETWTGNVGGQAWTFEETTGLLSVVPEPATWGLLAFSLTTVLVLRRRRR